MGPKTLVIIIAVLGALMFVGAGLGSNNHWPEGQDPPRPDWLKSLKNVLIREESMDPDAVTTTCRSKKPLTLLPGLPCSVEIPERDGATRAFRLQLRQGLKVTVGYEMRGDVTGKAETTIEPGESDGVDRSGVDLRVGNKGGAVTLRCDNPGTDSQCVVSIDPPSKDD